MKWNAITDSMTVLPKGIQPEFTWTSGLVANCQEIHRTKEHADLNFEFESMKSRLWETTDQVAWVFQWINYKNKKDYIKK